MVNNAMTLYATDLDGTLLAPDGRLTAESAAALNRLAEDGVLFTYATARSFASAAPLVEKLNLNCPAVTFNGVFVVDPKTGAHIIENLLPQKSLDIAREYIVSNGIAPLVYSYIDGRERVSYLADKADDVSGYVNPRRGDKRLRPVGGYKQLFEGSVFYITIINPADGMDILAEVFSGENGFSHNCMRDTYNPDIIWFEIFSKNASKAEAVLKIKKLVGAEQLVCFGDNKNDISMLRAADTGVAVANADDSVKAQADIIIGSNSENAVAEFISGREEYSPKADRFSRALGTAMTRIRGMHGSVGTQNEKLIHAALKSYYAPYSDEQEIKIGQYFADAVSEDGIFEIQTRALYRLREKLKRFTEAARVTVVYPVEYERRTVYISADTGEIVKETPFRKADPKCKIFEELYSLREFLTDRRVRIILARLKTEKRVYFQGNDIPDMRSRSTRRKITTEKIPLALSEEIILDSAEAYRRFLPGQLPGQFTKKEFIKLSGDGAASLRLEVLRAAGIIVQTGRQGKSYIYTAAERSGND